MNHRACPDHCVPAGPYLWRVFVSRRHENNFPWLPYGCFGLADFAGYGSNFWSRDVQGQNECRDCRDAKERPPNANNSNNAWNVNFNNGNANNNRNNNQQVRLVRSGE